jgi:hypothetical protein
VTKKTKPAKRVPYRVQVHEEIVDAIGRFNPSIGTDICDLLLTPSGRADIYASRDGKHWLRPNTEKATLRAYGRVRARVRRGLKKAIDDLVAEISCSIPSPSRRPKNG